MKNRGYLLDGKKCLDVFEEEEVEDRISVDPVPFLLSCELSVSLKENPYRKKLVNLCF